MLDAMVSWMMVHPLQAVGCLVGFAVTVGLFALEGMGKATEHGHPRT